MSTPKADPVIVGQVELVVKYRAGRINNKSFVFNFRSRSGLRLELLCIPLALSTQSKQGSTGQNAGYTNGRTGCTRARAWSPDRSTSVHVSVSMAPVIETHYERQFGTRTRCLVRTLEEPGESESRALFKFGSCEQGLCYRLSIHVPGENTPGWASPQDSWTYLGGSCEPAANGSVVVHRGDGGNNLSNLSQLLEQEEQQKPTVAALKQEQKAVPVKLEEQQEPAPLVKSPAAPPPLAPPPLAPPPLAPPPTWLGSGRPRHRRQTTAGQDPVLGLSKGTFAWSRQRDYDHYRPVAVPVDAAPPPLPPLLSWSSSLGGCDFASQLEPDSADWFSVPRLSLHGGDAAKQELLAMQEFPSLIECLNVMPGGPSLQLGGRPSSDRGTDLDDSDGDSPMSESSSDGHYSFSDALSMGADEYDSFYEPSWRA